MMERRRADVDVQARETARGQLKRRGLIAGAAALVAGIVAKAASDATPVGATNTDILHIGDINFSGNTLPTLVVTDIPDTPPNGSLSWGNRGQSDGIHGRSVSGGAAATAGVRGEISAGSNGSGVVGSFGAPPPASGGNGVYGFAGLGGITGVRGVGPSGGNGVKGVANGSAASYGVAGSSDLGYGGFFTGGGFSAVYGFSNGGAVGSGHGVYGTTNGTGLVAGLYGTSATAYGILGNTTAPFYSGLTATTATTNCAALAATSTNLAAFAAYFTGFTYVQGSFAVSGNKSAAVMHPDGTRRLLYCVEAPEAWFEDYGAGKLVGGKADVKLDPEFMALVHSDDYRVFLTPEGDSRGLYVTAKTAGGFSVRESQGGASNLSFSWRVLAKRKDSMGKRLEKFTPIKLHPLDPDKLSRPAPPKNP